jgi:predicted O-methyltransferase YrrM
MTWREVADAAKGWLFDDEAEALHGYARLAAETWPGLPLVEIGGYCGKSAIWIGAAAQEFGTVLYSIDHHQGSPEMAPGQDCHDPDLLDGGTHDSLPHFRRNIDAAGLSDSVIPVVGSSQVVGAHWDTPVSFLFIDGGHDTHTVTVDYKLWSPRLASGGVLAFHDTTDRNIAPLMDQVRSDGWNLAAEVESLKVFQ